MYRFICVFASEVVAAGSQSGQARLIMERNMDGSASDDLGIPETGQSIAQHLSVKETARLLSISLSTLYNLISEGLIEPPVPVSRGRKGFPVSAIHRYLNRMKQTDAARSPRRGGKLAKRASERADTSKRPLSFLCRPPGRDGNDPQF